MSGSHKSIKKKDNGFCHSKTKIQNHIYKQLFYFMNLFKIIIQMTKKPFLHSFRNKIKLKGISKKPFISISCEEIRCQLSKVVRLHCHGLYLFDCFEVCKHAVAEISICVLRKWAIHISYEYIHGSQDRDQRADRRNASRGVHCNKTLICKRNLNRDPNPSPIL